MITISVLILILVSLYIYVKNLDFSVKLESFDYNDILNLFNGKSNQLKTSIQLKVDNKNHLGINIFNLKIKIFKGKVLIAESIGNKNSFKIKSSSESKVQANSIIYVNNEFLDTIKGYFADKSMKLNFTVSGFIYFIPFFYSGQIDYQK